MAEIIVRREQAHDIETVYAINCAAFPADDEAKLADSLREQAPDCISMVAELEADLLGHLMPSPVMLDSAPHLRITGLVLLQPHVGVQLFCQRSWQGAPRREWHLSLTRVLAKRRNAVHGR